MKVDRQVPKGENDSAWWSMGLVHWHIAGEKEAKRRDGAALLPVQYAIGLLVARRG